MNHTQQMHHALREVYDPQPSQPFDEREQLLEARGVHGGGIVRAVIAVCLVALCVAVAWVLP